MITLANKLQDLLDLTREADFLAPLLLRLYLVPIFYEAGIRKFNSFEATVGWFASLGLPLPWLMAFLATATELGGAFLLAFGLATRWISIPLIFTMLVAAITVHWAHGWDAISTQAGPQLEMANAILREHGNYGWLTEHGRFVVLNNGIEFAATYIVMLLALFFIGGGRFVSVDYWLHRQFRSG